MTEALDPLRLPLRGSRLIEASAGTGKTWTIAALYLRLVLGHGDGIGRALLPAEILVMTFTKAATRELSDRIRARLVEAAACFRGETRPRDDDPFLAALLAAYAAADGARADAAWRLALAAEAMDDAAVHTIDAWCQRMLREHAFDSSSLFDEELLPDDAEMHAEAVRDYWRQQVYPLAGDALATVLEYWQDVDALLHSIRDLLGKPLPAGAGDGELGARIARATAQRAAALDLLKAGWVERAAAMRAWLDPLWQRKDKPIDGHVLGPAHGRRWINELAAWAADPQAETPRLGEGANRLTRENVLAALKPGLELDPPACFAEFTGLMAALPQLPAVAPALRAHAAARVAERLQQLKAQAGRCGFADMLDRLDHALDEQARGAAAQRLRERIVQQYPVALVDEFQDTSPRQLSIFRRLHGLDDDGAQRALLLIGDPKQSIYGFRGADIQSYLEARRATAGRHHVLGTNRRSTQALVAAVNGVFQAAEDRPGGGAFLYRGTPGDSGELPFRAVAAHGRDESFVTTDGPAPALVVCLDADLRNKGDSRARFAALCAERIVALLNDPGAGFARVGQPLQGLRPADLAVLVRTGVEAAAVRTALRACGVASVYLSDKDSVFDSDEARDLLRLLQAVAAPRDLRLARAALACALLGASLPELLALADDDARLDARCELLAELHGVWQAQGVLAMLRRALHAFALPARWLAGADAAGERRLTNVLHLAELLQAESAHLDGEQALLRWFAQQIDDAGAGATDEQVLRLESDADLVQVVTVHKSKGLEYPLVFLPFAAHFRAVERRNTSFVFSPDAQGVRRLVLAPSTAQLEAADHERLREDLRLLYVALTRARHGVWLGAAALRIGKGTACVWHRSAIGSLVSGAGPRSADALTADVHALAAAVPGLQIDEPEADPAQALPLPSLTPLRARAAVPPLQPALPYEARFDRSWAVSSYSALLRGAADEPRAAQPTPVGAPLRALRDDEPANGGDGDAAPRAGADAPWHRFPRGAFAGNFLHGHLEWLAGEGFALDGSLSLQQALRRRCERQGWGHRADDVLAWLRRLCTRPLPPLGAAPGTPLTGLRTLRPEMEFWFPSDGLRAGAIDALCRAHILPGHDRPPLPERALHGLLMGFADLVYECDGRYGVLDYKSNALGAGDADYTATAMAAAVLAHRYDVQAALYLLALHRLLRARLGSAYDPARHLHGALVLFLRGVASAGAGCFHLAPPLALIEALDAMLQPVAAVAT